MILLSGGSGLLGSTLQKLDSSISAPPHIQMDVTNLATVQDAIGKHKPDIFIHAAAFISPPAAEKEPMKALENNIVGTCNVVLACQSANVRLVYISTDYIYKGDRGSYNENDEILPQNKYTWSKLGGECAVRLYDNALIIRTSFGPDVFPYDRAFVDQYTSRDGISVIAPMILKLAQRMDVRGIVNVGTERKTVKELAIKLGKKDVGDMRREEMMKDGIVDTSFDLKKLKELL